MKEMTNVSNIELEVPFKNINIVISKYFLIYVTIVFIFSFLKQNLRFYVLTGKVIVSHRTLTASNNLAKSTPETLCARSEIGAT